MHMLEQLFQVDENVLFKVITPAIFMIVLIAIVLSVKGKKPIISGDMWELPAVINDSEGKDYIVDSKRFLEKLGFQIITKTGSYYQARAPQGLSAENQSEEMYTVMDKKREVLFSFDKKFIFLSKGN